MDRKAKTTKKKMGGICIWLELGAHLYTAENWGYLLFFAIWLLCYATVLMTMAPYCLSLSAAAAADIRPLSLFFICISGYHSLRKEA